MFVVKLLIVALIVWFSPGVDVVMPLTTRSRMNNARTMPIAHAPSLLLASINLWIISTHVSVMAKAISMLPASSGFIVTHEVTVAFAVFVALIAALMASFEFTT